MHDHGRLGQGGGAEARMPDHARDAQHRRGIGGLWPAGRGLSCTGAERCAGDRLNVSCGAVVTMGLSCRNCGYSLEGLTAGGWPVTCPECGFSNDPGEVGHEPIGVRSLPPVHVRVVLLILPTVVLALPLVLFVVLDPTIGDASLLLVALVLGFFWTIGYADESTRGRVPEQRRMRRVVLLILRGFFWNTLLIILLLSVIVAALMAQHP